MASVTKEAREERQEADGKENPDAMTVADQVIESASGEDRPMEEVHPQSPGAIVWFTYPLLLIVALLIIIAVLGIWKSI
ncbi:MAG: hypothetical protein KDA72_00080 [Planctomycetales bacterium]|nr:hypothetical protein [Planctomycetales bacterium]